MKTKHVLALLPFEAKKVDPMVGSQEFKLAVGYFAKYIQTFDIMADTDGNGYLFVDQKTSDVTYHEKPGISCFSAIKLKNKYLLL